MMRNNLCFVGVVETCLCMEICKICLCHFDEKTSLTVDHDVRHFGNYYVWVSWRCLVFKQNGHSDWRWFCWSMSFNIECKLFINILWQPFVAWVPVSIRLSFTPLGPNILFLGVLGTYLLNTTDKQKSKFRYYQKSAFGWNTIPISPWFWFQFNMCLCFCLQNGSMCVYFSLFVILFQQLFLSNE